MVLPVCYVTYPNSDHIMSQVNMAKDGVFCVVVVVDFQSLHVMIKILSKGQ